MPTTPQAFWLTAFVKSFKAPMTKVRRKPKPHAKAKMPASASTQSVHLAKTSKRRHYQRVRLHSDTTVHSCICTSVHACMRKLEQAYHRTCLFTRMHTFEPSCNRTDKRSYDHTFARACTRAFGRSHVRTSVHSFMHAFMHAYIVNAYLRTLARPRNCRFVHVYIRTFGNSYLGTCMHSIDV
jgi:hypothetical protein